MAKYLISFPSSAMRVQELDMQQVADDSHAVVREARAAGVWVFGGGIDESVQPVMIDGTGTVLESTYAESRHLSGGFTVLEVPSREVALEWAQKFAAACRCAQEVRLFGDDPES